MTTISAIDSAALLILQQTSSLSAKADKDQASDLVLVANGSTVVTGVARQPTQAQSKISESIFNGSDTNIAKLKIDLIGQAGKALGVERDAYASEDTFMAAMKDAFVKLKASDDGEATIAAIEKDLGLDVLGVTLRDVVDSSMDAGADKKLTDALKTKADLKDEASDPSKPFPVQIDEIGVYAPLIV